LNSDRCQATTKQSQKRRFREHNASSASNGSEVDASDDDEHERGRVLSKRKKKSKGSKGSTMKAEKENTKPAPVQKSVKVWGGEVEKLKELVAKIGKGLPGHIGFKIPPNVYRGNPSDEVVQKRIADFLLAKGLKDLTPNDKEIADFRKKVVRSAHARNCAVF
jgi:hypothetical protein